MKLVEIVTSLPLSIKLRQLGVNQSDSLFCWSGIEGKPESFTLKERSEFTNLHLKYWMEKNTHQYAALTLSELGNKLKIVMADSHVNEVESRAELLIQCLNKGVIQPSDV